MCLCFDMFFEGGKIVLVYCYLFVVVLIYLVKMILCCCVIEIGCGVGKDVMCLNFVFGNCVFNIIEVIGFQCDEGIGDKGCFWCIGVIFVMFVYDLIVILKCLVIVFRNVVFFGIYVFEFLGCYSLIVFGGILQCVQCFGFVIGIVLVSVSLKGFIGRQVGRIDWFCNGCLIVECKNWIIGE